MKFRNYCIVIMGNTKDAMMEIEKISETKPNVLDASGIMIATFMSSVEPRELSDWFRLNQRSFLIFDLNPDNSGFHITKPEIQEGLFGFIRNLNDDSLQEKANNFLKEVQMSSDTKSRRTNTMNIKSKEVRITKEDIAKMSIKEKEALQDKIIDNGIENMTDYDKEILGVLWE